MRNASSLLVALAAVCVGCGGSSSGPPTSDVGKGTSAVGTGDDSSTDTTDTSDGGDTTSETSDASQSIPPVGAWDGAVTDAACPKLPSTGWQNVSPPGSNYNKSYSGIDAVVVRPDNPAIVYAGADSNGIFRSTDCGASWSLVSTGKNAASMKSGRPWSMVIDPVTPDTMYAVEGYGADGLWKSTNAGVDWEQILTSNITAAFGQITGISMDPADHTHIVVESHQGEDSSAGKCGTDTCAAESTDSGNTWKLVTIPTPWNEGSAVAVLNRNTWVLCGVYKAIWYTENEGAKWTSFAAPNGAVTYCNWYEPYIFQETGGEYVLASDVQEGTAAVFTSGANSVASWTAIPNSPQGQTLMATNNSLVVAGGTTAATATYSIASRTNPTKWTSLAGPKTSAPTAANAIGGYGEAMVYDSTHHVLYSATYGSGLWQTVIE